MGNETQTYKAGKNDVTCIYAAKSLAPFFHATIPDYTTLMGTPKLSLRDRVSSLIDRILFAGAVVGANIAHRWRHPVRAIKEIVEEELAERESEEWMRRQDEELAAEYREDLRKAGIGTEQEHMAFVFAKGASTLFYMAAENMAPEHKKIITKAEFREEYTRAAILEGLRYIEDSFGIEATITSQGFNTALIALPNFEANVIQWLANEAYAREDKGEFVFLDVVFMSVDGKNVAWRPNMSFHDAYHTPDFKWSEYCGA